MLGFMCASFRGYNEDINRQYGDKIIYNNHIFINGDNRKFDKDKIFYEDNEMIIVIDGVIINKKQLINRYSQKDYVNTIKHMYRKDECFFKEFKGVFAGIIYDKVENKKIIFTNRFGDKQVFYGSIGANFIIGTDLISISKYLLNNGLNYELNERAAYSLLTYGFMVEDLTIIKELKKMLPGHYLVIKNDTLELKRYYEFNNKSLNNYDQNKTIDILDELFRDAVKLELDKDNEYDQEYHLIALSGGLDSRMTTWVANDLGYSNIVNYNFGKIDYLDEKIAKEISKDLGNQFIFKGLDDANFMTNIDETTKLNFGTSCYSGTAHQNSIYKFLNFDRFGLIHSGQLGDVVVGTFSSKPYHIKAEKQQGAYSTILLDKADIVNVDKYENEELFKMNIRGVSNLNPHTCLQHYTEIVSPFLENDFFDFCLGIPVEMRYKHKLYYKWLEKKYPSALNYIYEREKCKPTTNKAIMFVNKSKKELIRRGTKFFGGGINKNDMNPFDYWYRDNNYISNYMNDYFNENICRIDNNDELSKNIRYMFSMGSVREKMQVLTLLSTIKLYF